ncbi:LysR family transcriptional regulator [Exilibacterium tricleocarpae]|uniref:LysR family transcriptional regulator n=1 Tax=Exilibacterium tricleocarpae TaxID=2591008 RepID=A0A545TFT7_9GAMM|nr:LysR family transcriptional regulator [Exilibacterium tricleocarpae]TQV76065.1 LysR family transcriptional regulator [Exilibacterium tricleocarpae]
MIEKLEIHHLRTLDALYRFGKISAAAEYLDVSQQAVSLQVKKISKIMGDPLFVRTGHGVVPTPYAKLIEPHIRGVLNSLNNIPLPNSGNPGEIERTLVVSATDYTQEVIIGPLLKTLRKSAPKVKVIVVNIEVADLIRKMQQGDIDLALTAGGYVPEGLLTRSLFTEKYLCVSANKAIVFDDYLPLPSLAEQDFVVTSPGTGSFKGSADTWFEQQGLRRNVVISAPSFHITQAYLRQSDMVAFLPSRLLPCEGLFEIPLKKYPPGYEVVAAYHPSTKSDPFILWLLDHVNKSFAGSP